MTQTIQEHNDNRVEVIFSSEAFFGNPGRKYKQNKNGQNECTRVDL